MWMNNSLGIVAKFPDEHTCHQNQGNTVLSFLAVRSHNRFRFERHDLFWKGLDSGPHKNLAKVIVMKLCLVYLVQVEAYMLNGTLPLMAGCATIFSKI